MSFSKGSSSSALQVKLENEKDIFYADYKLPGSPDILPYRKIWDVAFYNNKAELVSLHEIAKLGPFVGVASAEKSEGVKEQFKNMNYKISLHPVIEYSLELPYGRQARIWVTTETACYRIMSVSANYTSYWQPFYEMVCFAGHVVNILLNYRGPIMMVKLITRISRLSGKNGEETYSLLRSHRKFIHDLLKDQNLSARIRKEYNSLQSNQATWEIDWEEHVKAPEKKPEKKEKSNILSFFRSRSKDENSGNSVNSSASSIDIAAEKDSSKNNFDETSSILSISEEESATYIEFPNEVVFEDPQNAEEHSLQSHLASSFTSARFLEWSLQESESLTNSLYNCPLCKVTFKSDSKDCISAFCVHLKAHRADFEEEPDQHEDDFKERFRRFRSDLQKCMTEKLSYAPMPLVFEKKLENFRPYIFGNSFKHYPVLESDGPVERTQSSVNPIKAIKFVVTAASLVAPSKPTSHVAPVSYPAPKKPRVRKPAAPKVPPQPVIDTTSSAPSTAALSAAPQVTAPVPLKTVILTPPKQNTTPTFLASSTNVSVPIVPIPTNTAQSISTSSSQTVRPQASPATIMNLFNTSNAPQVVNSVTVSTSVNVTSANTNPTPDVVVNRPLPPQQPSESIINLDTVISPLISLPIRAKRPLSAVPVPIELLSSEDSVTPPVPSLNDLVLAYSGGTKNLGCSHYKVNCKFYSECCGKWFFCRHCHDAVSDHKLNRHKTRFCVCLICGTSQKAGSRCVNEKCKALMAHYYCDKCKFWDNDANKLIYHCDKCGICRTGLQANYTHCDYCGKCVSKASFAGHRCEPRSPLKSTESLSSVFISSLPTSTKLKLSSSRPDSSNSDSKTDKKPRLDLSQEIVDDNSTTKTVPATSNIDAAPKPSVDQTNYVNYLKNSLNNWRDKIPSTSTITASDTKKHRNCWNCLYSIPDKADGSIQNKYCVHCSAIIE